MANLILPRQPLVSYTLYNYFMTAPAGGIALAANTAAQIGPDTAGFSWADNTGTAVTEFAVDPSTPAVGHQYGIEFYVDGQLQQRNLVTTVTNEALALTSVTAGTIPQGAVVTLTILDFTVS
jgi:hypothetical protein